MDASQAITGRGVGLAAVTFGGVSGGVRSTTTTIGLETAEELPAPSTAWAAYVCVPSGSDPSLSA